MNDFAGSLPLRSARTATRSLTATRSASSAASRKPGPQWRPLKRHDSHVAEQMVERAAEPARDSHARTRHAAVLMRDGSMLAWGTNGVPFPEKITATASSANSAIMTCAGPMRSSGRSRWP